MPILPGRKIERIEAEFVHDDEATYPAIPVPPVLPIAELPAQREALTSHGVLVSHGREQSSGSTHPW